MLRRLRMTAQPNSMFTNEPPVHFICCMQRDPPDYSHAEFHPRAGLDATRSADPSHRRERWRQQREGIVAFVEPKHFVYRCINDDTSNERRHIFSLSFQESRTPRRTIYIGGACC